MTSYVHEDLQCSHVRILFWFPCGLFCWMMTRTVLRDDLSEPTEEAAKEALTVGDAELAEKCCEATPETRPRSVVLGKALEEVSSCDE